MAKKNQIERNIKRINLNLKYSEKRKQLISMYYNSNDFKAKQEIHNKIQKLPLNSSKIRIRNRCSITGRPKGYLRDFGLSRHLVREMGHEGLLPGLVKSSW